MREKVITAIGVLVLLENKEQAVTREFLCKSLGISRQNIEEVIAALRDNGYVDSAKGPGGGYYPGLGAPSLDDITYGDIEVLFPVRSKREAAIVDRLRMATLTHLRNVKISDIRTTANNRTFRRIP